MAICDSQKFCIRSGSQNDQSVWNRSHFGQIAKSLIPRGYHILVDSGYALKPYLITPYDHENATPEQKKFNYIHSATRNFQDDTVLDDIPDYNDDIDIPQLEVTRNEDNTYAKVKRDFICNSILSS
ncbi:hypothetical protein ROZALSC1DRAFT_25646 [Rozella allomycis CSF55]|uniref:DDE Tnp4 domain-containing protein n=1 Tax=Rozella allomycis (strain CSF55) TaxID=988480 RepID=A0A4P9YAH7_ROZAC|nr:hypothetical protein ROZALSC1DRAFT_25646 [Rozella allomycis CSF55]